MKFSRISDGVLLVGSKDFLGLERKRIYEPLETQLIKEEVRKGGIVLDLGAHIGYFTLILSKLVGPTGKVFAFEPSPESFLVLQKNMKLNKCTNIRLEQKAVWNRNEKIFLYQDQDALDSPSNLIFDFLEPSWLPIRIEAIKLDDYFGGFQKIDFIKMDIEGCEPQALEGMSNLLRQNPDLKILVECNFYLLEQSEFGVKNFIKMLEDFGFELSYLDNPTRQKIKLNIDWLFSNYQKGTHFMRNLFGVRKK